MTARVAVELDVTLRVAVPDQPDLAERLAQITPECRALLKEAAELNLTLNQVIQHLKSL